MNGLLSLAIFRPLLGFLIILGRSKFPPTGDRRPTNLKFALLIEHLQSSLGYKPFSCSRLLIPEMAHGRWRDCDLKQSPWMIFIIHAAVRLLGCFLSLAWRLEDIDVNTHLP